MQNQTTTKPQKAEALEREWRKLGFTEGTPTSVSPSILQADIRIYRNQRCGECGHRGHKVTAFHRGGNYRLLCSCKRCGSGTEG